MTGLLVALDVYIVAICCSIGLQLLDVQRLYACPHFKGFALFRSAHRCIDSQVRVCSSVRHLCFSVHAPYYRCVSVYECLSVCLSVFVCLSVSVCVAGIVEHNLL